MRGGGISASLTRARRLTAGKPGAKSAVWLILLPLSEALRSDTQFVVEPIQHPAKGRTKFGVERPILYTAIHDMSCIGAGGKPGKAREARCERSLKPADQTFMPAENASARISASLLALSPKVTPKTFSQ
jgi:hypothetical protein